MTSRTSVPLAERLCGAEQDGATNKRLAVTLGLIDLGVKNKEISEELAETLRADARRRAELEA